MTDQIEPVAFSVDGKSAIITGAGSGINYCFAKLLLEKNCNVVIADLALRPEAQKLLDDYTTQPRAVFVKTDVVIWDQLTNMFDVADKEFGGADIVCPGAGIFEPPWTNFWHPPGTAQSKDDPHGASAGGIGHYACLDINITHPIRTTQLAISRWLNSTAGPKASPSNPKRVVHISSIAGQCPSFGVPLYIASKHAISGFVRSMQPLERALGIRVNAVAPGVIKTPLWTEHAEKLKLVDEATDVWVEPEEVALAMLRCVADAEVGGGYVMEVLKDKTRSVGYVMDPGPEGPGATVARREEGDREVLELLGVEGWGLGGK